MSATAPTTRCASTAATLRAKVDRRGRQSRHHPARPHRLCALKRRRALNTDAIDNSAGVDSSDHEVNIKILLDDAVARGRPHASKQRDELLAAMTDEVAALVLRDNYLQSQAISVAEAQAPAPCSTARAASCARWSAPAGSTARSNSCPTTRRSPNGTRQRHGLTRPELAVLLAYAKIALNDELLPLRPARRSAARRASCCAISRAVLRERYRDAAIAGIACAARSSRPSSPTAWSTAPASPSSHDVEGRDRRAGGRHRARLHHGARRLRAARALGRDRGARQQGAGRAAQLRALLAIGPFRSSAPPYGSCSNAERPIDIAARRSSTTTPASPSSAPMLGTLLAGRGRRRHARARRRRERPDSAEPLARRLRALPAARSGLPTSCAWRRREPDAHGDREHYFAVGAALRPRLAARRGRAVRGAKATRIGTSSRSPPSSTTLRPPMRDSRPRSCRRPTAPAPRGVEHWVASRGRRPRPKPRLIDELKAGATPLDLAMLAVANRQLRALVGG